jgi:hypothetical protein
MPQAIDRLLAMPVTRAFFPVKSSMDVDFEGNIRGYPI